MNDIAAPRHLRWLASFKLYLSPSIRPMLLLGFSSGLPFLLVFSTLSAWLTQSGIQRSTIGHLSWAGLMYFWKFFWSPIVDRLPLPILQRLGQRRSWMLLSQFGIVAALSLMAFADPKADIAHVALLAVSIAFASATQDIAIDAYRIELGGSDALQSTLAAAYQLGYRLALIAAGAGALYIAAEANWKIAYLSMAALVSVGMLTVFFIKDQQAHLNRAALLDEPDVQTFLSQRQHWPERLRYVGGWLMGAVVCPFLDYIRRLGWKQGLIILAFITCYRTSDFVMGIMANNFYLSLGFTLKEIAWVSKIYGVCMLLAGVILSTGLISRYGALRSSLIGLQAIVVANLGFSLLALHPEGGLPALIAVLSLDNIANGIEGTAFTVFLSQLVNIRYTATQFQLLYLVWALPSKFLGGTSGDIVNAVGFPIFYLICAGLAIPALLIGHHLSKRKISVMTYNETGEPVLKDL